MASPEVIDQGGEQRGDLSAEESDTSPKFKQVIYCGICSFPPEYCEFSGSLKKCKDWLEEEHPDLYIKLYSVEAIESQTASLSLSSEQEAKLSKDLAKKEAKQAAKDTKAAAEKASTKVLIKRVERGKRKYMTAICNLQTFDVDLKKASKTFANRFATGANVKKNLEGKDEIVVQGDLADEIEEMLIEQFSIPDDQIAIKEEKSKK